MFHGRCLLSRSKQTYSHLTNIEVNELRRIMSHKATEIPTYEAVPSASRFIETLLYSLSYWEVEVIDEGIEIFLRRRSRFFRKSGNTLRIEEVFKLSSTYVEGNCCSNLDLIDDAISCSVVKFAIASWAALMAASCITALMQDVLMTDLALISVHWCWDDFYFIEIYATR